MQIKQKFLLFNTRGASLMLALSTVALTGLVMLGILGYYEAASINLRKQNDQISIQTLNSEIYNLLTNEKLCSAILVRAGGESAQESVVDSELVLGPNLEKGKTYARGLKIESIKLTKAEAAKIDTRFLHESTFKPLRDGVISIYLKSGNNSYKKDFNLAFTEENGRFKSCYLSMDGQNVCNVLGGKNYGDKGQAACTMVTKEDCVRWGGKLQTSFSKAGSEYFYHDYRYDGTLKKNVTVDKSARGFRVGPGYRCDFCEYMGGIYVNRACVANTFAPQDLGQFSGYMAPSRYFRCSDIDFTKYRSCSDLLTSRCYKKGEYKEECYDGAVANSKEAGKELCRIMEYSCI